MAPVAELTEVTRRALVAADGLQRTFSKLEFAVRQTPLEHPNMDPGALVFVCQPLRLPTTSMVRRPILVGEDPRSNHFPHGASPCPRVQEAEIYHDGTFSVCASSRPPSKTKSHKAELVRDVRWGPIDTTEGTVFLDLDFDYGS